MPAGRCAAWCRLLELGQCGRPAEAGDSIPLTPLPEGGGYRNDEPRLPDGRLHAAGVPVIEVPHAADRSARGRHEWVEHAVDFLARHAGVEYEPDGHCTARDVRRGNQVPRKLAIRVERDLDDRIYNIFFQHWIRAAEGDNIRTA